MPLPTSHQNLILIEGAATYERILAEIREVETEEGIRHIQDFLKIYPEFAQAHNDAAVLFYQSGNKLKSLAHYERAHKLDPTNITYRKNLADFYFVELEWTGEAIHSYLEILKDNPFDTETLNALGSISLSIGRREQARQYFSRTLQLDANNREAQLALQQISPQAALPDATPAPQNQRDQTSEYQQKVGDSKPQKDFQDLFRVKKLSLEPVAETTPQLNQSSEQAAEPPQTPEELYRAAMSSVRSDNLDVAINLLEKLLLQDTQYATAHNDLGVLYQKKGNTSKSRFHHEQAVKLQPANKMFQKNLADLLLVELYELEEALAIYVKLQAKSPQDIEILKAITTICLAIGNQTDARFFLDRILALQPWDREAQEALRSMEETARTRA